MHPWSAEESTSEAGADAKPPFLRTAYNYNRDRASDEAGLYCPEPTRTKQSFKEECDINTIVKRFGLTGQLPDNLKAPQYGDYTGIQDFHTAANVVAQAQEEFDQLPAAWRKRFHHDPQEFLEFVENEENRDEAAKMGLVRPKPKETPPKTPEPPKTAPEPSKGPDKGGVT